MLPWGHLGVGYLVYSIGTRIVLKRAPQGGAVLVLVLGTQFPDLIDKPLNWWFGTFDGRALGHSLLTTIPICVLMFFVSKRYERGDLAVAFSIGVLTHLLADAWRPLLEGNFKRITYLLWPLFPPPTYPADSLVDHLYRWQFHFRMLQEYPTSLLSLNSFGIQLLLIPIVFFIWALDGFPGIRTAWNLIIRRSGTIGQESR